MKIKTIELTGEEKGLAIGLIVGSIISGTVGIILTTMILTGLCK